MTQERGRNYAGATCFPARRRGLSGAPWCCQGVGILSGAILLPTDRGAGKEVADSAAMRLAPPCAPCPYPYAAAPVWSILWLATCSTGRRAVTLGRIVS